MKFYTKNAINIHLPRCLIYLIHLIIMSVTSVLLNTPFLFIFLCPFAIKIVNTEEFVCPGIAFRNSLELLNIYQNQLSRPMQECTVIEGNVQMSLVIHGNSTQENYSSFRFPKVREITGYLMVFRVGGLKSLGSIFPELRVIRGLELVYDYALIIFRNSDLSEIGLTKLQKISRGGVRISENENLCFAKSINWTLIVSEPALIEANAIPELCSSCHKSRTNPADCVILENTENNSSEKACWNRNHCQKKCAEKCTKLKLAACQENDSSLCCDAQCLGSCFGHSAKECYACQNVHFNGTCIEKCPAGYFEYLNRRCVTADECRSFGALKRKNKTPQSWILDSTPQNLNLEMAPQNWNLEVTPQNSSLDYDPKSVNLSGRRVFYKPIETTGQCTRKCPANFEENPQNPHTCQKCPVDTGCTKICYTKYVTIQSVSDSARLIGCTVLKGPLDITIYSLLSSENIETLVDNLASIIEVSDYVKIALTPALTSLNFLRNLRLVHGLELWYERFSIAVFGNDNLASTLNNIRKPESRKLKVLRGAALFINNAMLCQNLIGQFIRSIDFIDPTFQHDVSSASNGYRAMCEEVKLNMTVVHYDHISVTFHWLNFDTSTLDHRTFLGYKLYYRETLYPNASLTENRNTCSDKWQMIFMSPGTSGKFIEPLKPFTLYAFYLQTSIVHSSSAKGGVSDMVYVRTKAYFPSAPILESLAMERNGTLIISWLPPNFPNGQITHYMVRVNLIADIHDESDYCREPTVYTKNVYVPYTMNYTRKKLSECSHYCCAKSNDEHCAKSTFGISTSSSTLGFESGINGQTELAAFEDKISEAVFKNFNPTELLRRKRGDNYKISDASNESSAEAIVSNEIQKASMLINTFLLNTTSLNSTFIDLKHFRLYEIKIWACQNVSIQPSYCSKQEITTVHRTLAIEENDDTLHVTEVKPFHNNISRFWIGWSPPENPNGPIMAYEIQYIRSGSTDQSQKHCVTINQYENQQNGTYLPELLPGDYTLRIRTLTTAARGRWSDAKTFTVADNSYSPPSALVICLVLLFFVVAFVAMGLSVRCYYRRRDLRATEIFKYHVSHNPDYVADMNVYVVDHWELQRDDLIIMREIGSGSFGTVNAGCTASPSGIQSACGERFTACAIKMLRDKTNCSETFRFLHEAAAMKKFTGAPFVIKLYGVVSSGQPTLIVMEYMSQGNLRSYLMSRRPDDPKYNTNGLDPPTFNEVARMAAEIADGMAFLEAMKFCHMDLAARNCLVGADGTCKIGDFGMTRDVYDKEYYRLSRRRLIPVRWMSPEALKDYIFTTKSDVWAYGVVLWEIITLAKHPFPGLSNEEVMEMVVDQKRTMAMPTGCPHIFAEIMRLCWTYDAQSRPAFCDLVHWLLDWQDEKFKEISFYCNNYLQPSIDNQSSASVESFRLLDGNPEA